MLTLFLHALIFSLFSCKPDLRLEHLLLRHRVTYLTGTTMNVNDLRRVKVAILPQYLFRQTNPQITTMLLRPRLSNNPRQILNRPVLRSFPCYIYHPPN